MKNTGKRHKQHLALALVTFLHRGKTESWFDGERSPKETNSLVNYRQQSHSNSHPEAPRIASVAELIQRWICCRVKGRAGLQGCSLVSDGSSAAAAVQQHRAAHPCCSCPSHHPPCSSRTQNLLEFTCSALLSAPCSLPERKLNDVSLPFPYFSRGGSSNYDCGTRAAERSPWKWGIFTPQQNPSGRI